MDNKEKLIIKLNELKKEDDYKDFWEKKAHRSCNFTSPKRLFVPDMESLYKMQEMGANIYDYLLIKAGEALIIDGVNHPHKGIFKNAYKYLREDSNLATMICSIYPVEALYSDIAKYDTTICSKLLEEKDNSIYRLDNLAYFNTNSRVIEEKVIDILANELYDNPKYRFEYKSSDLLDNIFSGKYDYSKYYSYNKRIIWDKLIKLEPAYILTEDKELLDSITDSALKNLLKSSLTNYLYRYNLSMYTGQEYEDKDVLTNPDENVKRLIKCINERK